MELKIEPLEMVVSSLHSDVVDRTQAPQGQGLGAAVFTNESAPGTQ